MKTIETFNKGAGINLNLDDIVEALKLLHTLTGVSTLEEALTNIKFITTTNEQKNSIDLISRIYIAEMNGDLIPDPSIKKLYIDRCCGV